MTSLLLYPGLGPAVYTGGVKVILYVFITVYQQFPSTILNHLEIQQIRKHAGFLLVEHPFTWKKKSKQVPFLYTQDFMFWYIFFIEKETAFLYICGL
jgi:hypothetical protein